MRKILLVLTILLMAAPAWAGITVEAKKDGSEITLSYQMDQDDPNLPRAFALEVTLTQENDAKIDGDPYGFDPNFWVYPGSIDINDDGTVDEYGSPVAFSDGNMMIIEMGSLYEMGVEDAPEVNGVLLKFLVTADCNVTLAENAARGGVDSNGVVMEDTTQTFTADYVKLIGTGVGVPPPPCETCRGDWNGNNEVDLNTDLLPFLGKLSAAKFFLDEYAYTEADTVTYVALQPWNPCMDWNGDDTCSLNEDLLPMLGKLSFAKYLLDAYTYPCCDATIDPCP